MTKTPQPIPDDPEMERIKKTKLKLQMLGIMPNDTNIQMFQELFDVDEPIQLTVLPNKTDVTHVLCLGAVDKLTAPVFSDPDMESLPRFLFKMKVLGMRSYKGTFAAMFQHIFEQNPPQELLMPNQLPTAIPQDQKRSLSDKLLGRNKE